MLALAGRSRCAAERCKGRGNVELEADFCATDGASRIYSPQFLKVAS